MPADLFAIDPLNLAAIAGMALVTLATRFAGYLAVGRFAVRGRLAAALEGVPPAVLTSLVAPMAFATGPAETIAAAATVLAAWKLPTLAAAVIGVGAVVALRALLG
ncbi:MAG: AzlD domain-containing protein [Marivibrio sp.]|uniref:AzlD family protein n=1 Tax=Marivibrio sp. TaxID=2039719 RepID=UPI0032ED162F